MGFESLDLPRKEGGSRRKERRKGDSSMVEQLVYTEEVVSSSLTLPISKGEKREEGKNNVGMRRDGGRGVNATDCRSVSRE